MSAVTPIPARYVRTNGGSTVHRADCFHLRRAKHAHEWWWAEGMDPDEIVRESEKVGLHYYYCATCLSEVAFRRPAP